MKKILLMISIFVFVLNCAIFAEEDSVSERPFLSVGLTGLYPKPQEIDEGSETLFIFKKIPIKGPLIKIEKKPFVKVARPKKEKKITKRIPEQKLSEKKIKTLEEALYEDTTNKVLRDLGYIE